MFYLYVYFITERSVNMTVHCKNEYVRHFLLVRLCKIYTEYRERKCADAIGTVLVPWASHFQCQT